MAAVSETIVREYFELHGFFVRQQRKYLAQTRREDEEIDFFVLNPRAQASATPLPFVLSSADLMRMPRAVVVVKGWHTETFSLAVLANAPEIFRFVEPAVYQQAGRAFGEDGPLYKILVVPALPQGAEARDQSIALLRSDGLSGYPPRRVGRGFYIPASGLSASGNRLCDLAQFDTPSCLLALRECFYDTA